MCWVSSKVITRYIAEGLRSSDPQHRKSSPRGTPPKFGWNRGGVDVLNRKPAISRKRGNIGQRKLHTRFRSVPKSITLDDRERPFRTVFQNARVFGAHHENVNEDRPVSAGRCSAVTVVSSNLRVMWTFAGVPWRRGVKREWGNRRRRSLGLSDATPSTS